MQATAEQVLRSARRIVIKVGTSTVTGGDGQLRRERVQPIAQSIADLMKQGRQLVLVSSEDGSACTNRDWTIW